SGRLRGSGDRCRRGGSCGSGGRGGRGAEHEVQATGGGHRGGTERRVLEPQVVRPDRAGERRGRQQRTASGGRGQAETRGRQCRGGGERAAGCDPPGRQRPGGTFEGVHVPVGVVVERHARLVQAHRGRGGQRGPAV